jgi:fatty-acyl-CoA synthase/feruloyl-CoA synthase
MSDPGVFNTSGVTMATLGGALALNARRHPDKTALIFGESIYSYEQLAARTDQYAHALASLGVGKGDRVALLSPNSDAYVLGLYGAFRLGAIAVPLNPRVPARELRYLLEDSGATVLLYSEELAVVVAGLDELDPLPSAPQSLVLDEAAAQGIARLADTMPTTAPEAEVIEDDDCIILYTSGTTGRPKGALFDHHRMLWVGNSVSALGMNSFDRNLHVAPMYHCAELVLFVMSGFSLGTTHVVLPAFEPKAVLDALEKHRITVFLGVPTMYQMLLQYPELGTRDLSAWRLGFFGAAPMPPNAARSKRCAICSCPRATANRCRSLRWRNSAMNSNSQKSGDAPGFRPLRFRPASSTAFRPRPSPTS